MKQFPMILLAALLLLMLVGCNIRNNPPVRPLVESPNVTTTQGKPGAPTKSFATVAPGKTASQDTAGINSSLPEAATALGATPAP